MAVFEAGADNGQALDYVIARSGFATMYWSRTVLAKDITWLRAHGYHVVTVDAGLWDNQTDMYQTLVNALNLPDCHESLSALDDRLTEVRDPVHGLASKGAGLVLLISRFDHYTTWEPQVAHALLDIFTGHAAVAALVGIRMLCLVQSDDPDLEIPEIGAHSVPWNRAEFFHKTRHGKALGHGT
jgi:hypothetical protein